MSRGVSQYYIHVRFNRCQRLVPEIGLDFVNNKMQKKKKKKKKKKIAKIRGFLSEELLQAEYFT